MPFSLGLYDLFTNIVPGFLYLYIIVEFLQSLGWKTMDLTQVDTLGELLAATIIAYILGSIIGSITYNYWYKVFYKTHSPQDALTKIRETYPDIPMDFKPDDNDLVFAVIRHHEQLLVEKMETARVNSIMLRSLSLGLFLYGQLQIWLTFARQQVPLLLIAVAAFVLSGIALKRSRTFYKWFYTGVFLEGLNYGSTAQEVLATSRKIVSKDIASKTNPPLNSIQGNTQ
jgi:hypothetical protein